MSLKNKAHNIQTFLLLLPWLDSLTLHIWHKLVILFKRSHLFHLHIIFAAVVHVTFTLLLYQLVHRGSHHWSKWSQHKSYGTSKFGTGAWATAWASIQWLRALHHRIWTNIPGNELKLKLTPRHHLYLYRLHWRLPFGSCWYAQNKRE